MTRATAGATREAAELNQQRKFDFNVFRDECVFWLIKVKFEVIDEV
jgi:hypothetical protein